jgi:hypothetical protein
MDERNINIGFKFGIWKLRTLGVLHVKAHIRIEVLLDRKC